MRGNKDVRCTFISKCLDGFSCGKRKLDRAIKEIERFLEINGIQVELRKELQDDSRKVALLNCLPEEKDIAAILN